MTLYNDAFNVSSYDGTPMNLLKSYSESELFGCNLDGFIQMKQINARTNDSDPYIMILQYQC